MARFHLERGESALTLFGPEQSKPVAEQALAHHRRQLLAYIESNPEFRTTLDPWEIDVRGEGELVRRMCSASKKVSLGPMSAVAGTLAQLIVEDLQSAGTPYALADNGGDIYACCHRSITIGIFGGQGKLAKLAFEIPPGEKGWSVCTSSGTIGPSISLGCADAAVVVGTDGAVCDASATALGNVVTGEHGLESCFNFLSGVECVDGAMVLVGKKIATWGELPPIRQAAVPQDIITRGR
jgi:ApbE superfamily uncharacterized protein (UPF0280 family)